jgi:hypothetical protein
MKKWFLRSILYGGMFLTTTYCYACDEICVGGQSLEEALICAIERLDSYEVQRLIAAGADSNACIRNKTPLYVALQKITKGYDVLDIIRQLLETGASLDTKIIDADQEYYTVGEYAEESLNNYIENLESYRLGGGNSLLFNTVSPLAIKASDEEITLCIQRARKVLKLIKRYLAP